MIARSLCDATEPITDPIDHRIRAALFSVDLHLFGDEELEQIRHVERQWREMLKLRYHPD